MYFLVAYISLVAAEVCNTHVLDVRILLGDQGLPHLHLNVVLDTLVLSRLWYVIPAWSGFLSVAIELKLLLSTVL